MPDVTADLIAGSALLLAGAAIWLHGRRGTANPLLALTGVAWFAGDLSSALLYAHRGPLVHVLLSYPSGRVRSRGVAAVTVVAYIDGFLPSVARSPWATLVLMAAVVSVAAWRFRRAPSGLLGLALATAIVVAGALAFARVSGTNVWVYDLAVAVSA